MAKDEIETWLIKDEQRRERELNRQVKKLMPLIEKVETRIKSRKTTNWNFELQKIEQMKAYLQKYKFLPQSFLTMLAIWYTNNRL